MNRPDDELSEFLPLGRYEPPSSPAAHVAQRLLRRARRILGRDAGRVVEDDRLRQASRATIDDHTASPDCSLLARELDATLGDWADASGDVSPGDRLRLVVIPPGDVDALLETWASRHGHAVLDAPDTGALVVAATAREEIGTRVAVGLPDLDGTGVLVVPRLERWFLRHRHGLGLVRALLAELATARRRCVVGCNSWAWAYLGRAVEADLFLPEPLTFAPFDAGRLRLWFKELAEHESTRNVVFRESASGKDVLARGDDGELESDFLPSLAAESRGIPWVAWQLWQRSLRTRRVDKDEDGGRESPAGERSGADRTEDENTLWVVHADGFVLPGGHERTAFLVLHALLLHGRLRVDELALVLPLVGESGIVSALLRAGFVERVGGRYRCAPAAYPTIVERLATAGVPMPVA